MAEGTKSCVELIQRKERKLGTDMLTLHRGKWDALHAVERR